MWTDDVHNGAPCRSGNYDELWHKCEKLFFTSFLFLPRFLRFLTFFYIFPNVFFNFLNVHLNAYQKLW